VSCQICAYDFTNYPLVLCRLSLIKLLEKEDQIAEIFNPKRTHYTENTVYPALRFKDFNAALFPKSEILFVATMQITHGLH
jgi:hypothetical protein